MIYFVSDMHFWTPSILSFAERPFASLQEMHDTIVSKWKAKVKPTDTVFVLGDQGYPSEYMDVDNAIDEYTNYMNMLPGKKYLVRGNHDSWAFNNEWLVKQVYVDAQDLMLVRGGNCALTLCHYPIEQWPRCYQGGIHIHGHIHLPKFCNVSQNIFYRNIPGRLCCCVDMCDWEPKTLRELQQAQQPDVPIKFIDSEYLTRYQYIVPEDELLG